MNPKLDFYFNKKSKWQTEFETLRAIALSSGLNEELKWGHPCYTYNNSNIFLIHGFKEYCAFLFFKGVLLKDPNGILIQQTKNVQAARQIRFKNNEEIIKLKKVLTKYITNAIEIEKKGLKIELKETKEFEIPIEFKTALKNNTSLNLAFKKLSPGRQRAYLLYFSQAKQSKTREIRIEKSIPLIMIGKGLND